MTAPTLLDDPFTETEMPGAPNLAVDLLPGTGGRGDFVLDVSELDGVDQLGYGFDGGTWVNYVCDVTRVTLRRGATRLQGPLTRAELGTCTVSVRDTERRLDPTINGDAIHKGVPFRIRAWGVDNPFEEAVDGGGVDTAVGAALDGGAAGPAPPIGVDGGVPEDSLRWEAVLFTGVVDDLDVVYDKIEPPTVTISALDIIGALDSWGSAGYADPGVGAGDDLRARVDRILAEIGGTLAGRVSPDSDAAYTATLAASNLAAGWSGITDAQEAELGQVWVDNADQLVVRGRWSELSGPVRGTLSDIHDEIVAGSVHCCYTDPSVVYGTELLTNRAIVSRRVPNTGGTLVPAAVAQVDDEYSAARYGLQATEARSLELQTDAQLAPWGQALIASTTEPELRVDAVRPAPWNAPEAWQAVCATDIGDRWVFRLRPVIGPAVARTLGVLGIEADLSPAGWSITWHTADAPTPGDNNPSGWFALDVSELDSGDLLPPFGGMPA